MKSWKKDLTINDLVGLKAQCSDPIVNHSNVDTDRFSFLVSKANDVVSLCWCQIFRATYRDNKLMLYKSSVVKLFCTRGIADNCDNEGVRIRAGTNSRMSVKANNYRLRTALVAI